MLTQIPAFSDLEEEMRLFHQKKAERLRLEDRGETPKPVVIPLPPDAKPMDLIRWVNKNVGG